MAVQQNDILRVTASMTYGIGGQLLENVFHFKANDAVVVLDPQALIDMGTVIELLFATTQVVTPNTIQYTSYTVKNVTQNLLLGTAPWPTFVAGGDISAIASPQVAALVIGRTSKPRVQSRIFIAGLREGSVSAGIIDGILLTALVALAATLLLPYQGLVQRYQYVAYNRALATSTIPVSSAVILPTRSQRRRSIGFGA